MKFMRVMVIQSHSRLSVTIIKIIQIAILLPEHVHRNIR